MAESAAQIEKTMDLCPIRYDIHVNEQTTVNLAKLADLANDLKDKWNHELSTQTNRVYVQNRKNEQVFYCKNSTIQFKFYLSKR